MDKTRIQQALSAVRVRQQWQSVFGGATIGLLASAAVCFVIGLCRFVLGDLVPIPVLAAVAVAGPALGGVLAGLQHRTWKHAALAVDRHYKLKDRTLTALQFVADPKATALHQLQVEDAAAHLKTVDAREVVPFRIPRPLGWSLVSVFAATAALVWPLDSLKAQADSPQPVGIALAADQIADDLEALEEIAEEGQIEELSELVEQLKEKLEELRRPEVDVREALATISEMQAAIQARQAEYDIEAMNAQLSALGDALETAAAFEAAAAALQNGDFEKAADALERVDPTTMDRAEAKSTSERLAEAANAMQKAGMHKLSESVSELSDTVKANASDAICESSSTLAKEVRKQALAQKLSRLLNSQSDKLGESKLLCRKSGPCSKCGGNCPAGECQGSGQAKSLAQAQAKQTSGAPGQTAGSSSSGNINGDPTLLQGQTQMAELTGQLSESGDSDFETTTSPDGSEQAQRKAREAFAKYEKLSEAVLDSESIPLGHRRTIRNYFESIRPAGDQEASPGKQPPPGEQPARRTAL